LIAEEVAEVYPDLVAHSADGQIETVKYQVLDSMLLNEVQRQQKEIGSQQNQIEGLEEQVRSERQQNLALQERMAKLEAALAALASGSAVP
jgi:peptidoglycan hydrolase CwlO-like protein